MGRKKGQKEYTIALRNRVYAARKWGISAKKVAESEGITPQAVYRIVANYNQESEGANRPRSGRPATLSERDKRAILREIDRNPFISSRELCEIVDLSCTADTITRYLQSKGIMHHLALTRPKLTSQHATARLEFARKYVDVSVDFWKRWIFSDETTIERGCGAKQPWVWARRVSRDMLLFITYN